MNLSFFFTSGLQVAKASPTQTDKNGLCLQPSIAREGSFLVLVQKIAYPCTIFDQKAS